MIEEMKPAQPEKVEVCSEAAPVLKRKGRGIDLSSLTPEELKAHKKTINDKSQKKRSESKKASGLVFDSRVEPTKADAKRLLEERGLRNEHVIDLCYRLALIAAEQKDVTPNRFYFQNGLRQTLASYEAEAPQPLETIADEEVAGELLNRSELYALFDFGFWRQTETTFDQWLADRLKFKMSAFELSKILGKEDFGAKHEEWTDFAPRWNPLGLRPHYTQKEALTWLDAQSEKKRFLLVASRNSMKSTWARILALTLTITYPDARILIVSETNKLSKKAMKEFRGYLEMTPNSPTLFQQYFTEFTIAPDSGEKLIYDNPLAHLGLPQNSVESSSMESANTGSRFDFCLFDDPISRDNGTANEEQRAAAIAKHGSIMKLREPAGYAMNIQTPWVADDLGDVMIKRNDEDPEKPLAVRIDPVMEIKPEARGKNLLELTEGDVILNFLPKLNWKFVRDEMRSPEGINFFKTQYLCLWVSEDDQIKVNFDHDLLWSRVRPQSFFAHPLISQTFLVLDRSWSTSKYADFSCANICRVQTVENKMAMIVTDTFMDRVRESELVLGLVKLIEKWKPTVVLGQQDKGYLDFQDSLRKACLMRGIPVPYLRFVPVNIAPRAKVRRVKALELPLSDRRLWFASGNVALEACLLQMEKFDGVTASNSHRKDDYPDCVALGWEYFGPKHQEEIKAEDSDKRKQEEAEEQAREARRAYHQRMFGNTNYQSKPETPQPEPQQPVRPFPRGGSFAALPNSMTRRNR